MVMDTLASSLGSQQEEPLLEEDPAVSLVGEDQSASLQEWS